jgi:L-fuconolactonase
MKIDAEVHFWKFDTSTGNQYIRNNKILNQHYLPEQLSQSLHRNGIKGCIAVVSEDMEVETRFLSELALTHPEIQGVIGWTDLNHLKSADKIQELHQYTPLKGFRIELIKDSIPSHGVMKLLTEYQYSLDITLRPGTHLDTWVRFIQTYPGQQFILQNGGNPETHGAPEKEWETSIRELAKNQNLSCKVSGLLTGGIDSKSWKPADLYPYLDILFDSFGVERLLFASDWPFILLAGMYVQWKSLLEKYTEKFSPEDQDTFFGENAARIYRI